MLPPAPGTFSITSGWPGPSAAPSTTMRGTTSEAPPGPKGTTSLTGLAGKVWACAASARARPRKSATLQNPRNGLEAANDSIMDPLARVVRALFQRLDFPDRRVVIVSHPARGRPSQVVADDTPDV